MQVICPWHEQHKTFFYLEKTEIKSKPSGFLCKLGGGTQGAFSRKEKFSSGVRQENAAVQFNRGMCAVEKLNEQSIALLREGVHCLLYS